MEAFVTVLFLLFSSSVDCFSSTVLLRNALHRWRSCTALACLNLFLTSASMGCEDNKQEIILMSEIVNDVAISGVDIFFKLISTCTNTGAETLSHQPRSQIIQVILELFTFRSNNHHQSNGRTVKQDREITF